MLKFSPFSLIPVIALLALSACDNAGERITAPAEAPDVSLSDIGQRIASDEVRDTQAPAVDSAAANINPFKPHYSYPEREAFETLLEKARQDEDYLDRSLALTKDSLSGLPLGLEPESYGERIACAAAIDAASRAGQMPAHHAQKSSAEMIALALGEIDHSVEILDEEGNPITKREGEQRMLDFRKRTYLNYFLTRDQLMASETPEALMAAAQACLDQN